MAWQQSWRQLSIGIAGLTIAGLCGSVVGSATSPVTASTSMVAPKPSAAELAAGKKAFLTVGCSGCHTLTTAGAKGAVGPTLNHIGRLRTAKWILVQIANPCAPGHEHAAGPNYSCLAMTAGLAKGKTAQAIADFLASQK